MNRGRLGIVFIFSLYSNILISQGNPLIYERVIDVPGVLRNDLFNDLREWLAIYYKSAQDVVQVTDEAESTIVGKGAIELKYSWAAACYSGFCRYAIKLQAKDERFKIELFQFIHENCQNCSPSCELGLLYDRELYAEKGMDKHHNNFWKELRTRTDAEFQAIVKDLDSFISSKTNKSGEDW